MSKDLVIALRALVGAPVGDEYRIIPQARGSARRVVAASKPIAAPVTATEGGGGSISSPLTETGRTYHPERTVMSTDGFFGLRVTPCASISFTDANGDTVLFNLADPV